MFMLICSWAVRGDAFRLSVHELSAWGPYPEGEALCWHFMYAEVETPPTSVFTSTTWGCLPLPFHLPLRGGGLEDGETPNGERASMTTRA